MTDATADSRTMLAHNVYFTLKDDSPAAIDHLLSECSQYLTDHPGVVFFAAGTLNHELNRPVNDHGFHVAVHVVFETKQHQDDYQVSDSHKQFIANNNDNWLQVRVFDSDVG